MLRSFFIIALRILWRNKVTSFINILSLTIGITAFILIMLYVHYEMSYDKFNENSDRIYRLEAGEYGKFPPIIGEYIKEKVTGVENIVRLAFDQPGNMRYIPEDNPEKFIDIEISHYYWADSSLFEVFTLPFVKGNPNTALKDPLNIIITEDIAEKLFGDEDPIGKTVNDENRITGVIKNIEHSHIEIDVINSLGIIENHYSGWHINDQPWMWGTTYLLLGDGVNLVQVEKEINQVLAEINDGTLISIKFDHFSLRPLKEIYLKGSAQIAPSPSGKYGNLRLVQSFIMIAVFILALACINYINLTTARATLRNKEVAVKKVTGSSRYLLQCQFITESVLVTIISYLIAYTLVQGLLPPFNQLAMTQIQINELYSPTVIVLSILGVLSIGIISGLYPAIYLSAVKSISLIKGESKKGSAGVIIRKALLTFQFTISIMLLIGILTNLRQLRYARTFDMGFTTDHIIRVHTQVEFDDTLYIYNPQHTQYIKRETIKERLLQNPEVLKVSFIDGAFSSFSRESLLNIHSFENNGQKQIYQFIGIDPDFLDLMGIELVEGRNFSWDRKGDDRSYGGEIPRILINETAAKLYYDESPVGKLQSMKGSDGEIFQLEVIGIVKDFHTRSLHYDILPAILVWYRYQNTMYIRISPDNIPSTLEYIEKEFRNVYESYDFKYYFLDETFDRLYKSDEQAAKIIGYFTVLSIIIACMGLFALSSFMAVRRTKEIGIRKAMGATSKRIFLLLSMEFAKWVLVSVIIAVPAAIVMMNKWLQNFAYHIKLRADIFLLAALIALFIAMLTVIWQSLKTAKANPVDALRYE